MSGKLRSSWSDQYNGRLVSNKRLIKSTRANLFLGWLNRNFPDVPIILLIKHSCAVASSKLKPSSKSSPKEWDTTLDKYLMQSTLVEDYLSAFIENLEKANTLYKEDADIFENYILGWCIENYVPLMQLKNGQLKSKSVHNCFYEELCIDLHQAANKMFDFLGEKYALKRSSLSSKPSSQTQESSAILRDTDLIEGWREHITPSQQNRAMEIISLFN